MNLTSESEPHMTDLSSQWVKDIEAQAKENSAKTLSTVLGISTGEAADKLLEAKADYADSDLSFGFQEFLSMGKVLGLSVENTSVTPSKTTISFTDRHPTVVQWLEDNPTRLAILRRGRMFLYVGMGMMLAKASGEYMGKRERVTHVIFLD